MNVLIACEYSGRVRDAFTKRGHCALSCDILPTESPGNHHQGDVTNLLTFGWDLIIAHPPCTYISKVNAQHYSRERFGDEKVNKRLIEQRKAIDFSN